MVAGASATREGCTVLGIDPGTLHFGWGIIRRVRSRPVHIAHGVIHPVAKAPLGERLVAIETALVDILRRFSPQEAAIESLIYAKDPSAAAKLGHARGVALLVCTRAALPVGEYPPSRVKAAVSGEGAASKVQVARFVQSILGLSEAPPLDASDALAVALTHLQKASYGTTAATRIPKKPADDGAKRVAAAIRTALAKQARRP
jgi:crossover junction endodeoxyribonuclease RuvC